MDDRPTLLQPHPLADVLPLIEGNDFEALKRSLAANGLRDPIVTFEGMILDGRNRYRACLATGVEPRFETFHGTDPIAFVADKNLHRRQLTPGQKAMAVEKYATLSNGQTLAKVAVGKPTARRRADIAALVGINKATVSDARTIVRYGTPEEIEAVTNGSKAISRVAKRVRARRDGGVAKPDRAPDFGCRVRPPPPGKTVTGLAREAIALQRKGSPVNAALKQVGLSALVFARVRDLVLLSERDDVDDGDRALVQLALAEIDRTRRVQPIWERCKSIIDRYWQHRHNRLKRSDRSERAIKKFENAITFLHHTCESAAATIVIPPQLTPAQGEAAVERLKQAEGLLRGLARRILRESNT